MADFIAFFESLRFDARGLIPAIVRDEATKDVLMHVYINREGIERCLETGLVHYYSLRMRKVCQKGESSGHRQKICSIRLDCEGSSLLLSVEPLGGACENGYRSCFYRQWTDGAWVVCDEKVFDPEMVYPEFIFSH